MPEVDFMIVCDYVRGERDGLLHMIAGGIERLRPQRLPVVQQIGIGIRLSFTRVECDMAHEVQLIFQNEDGQRIMQMDAQVSVAFPEGVPPGGVAHASLPLNVGLPIEQPGRYSFELLVGRQSKKSAEMLVEPPSQA